MTEIYLFPGEHSCQQGMGEDLFRAFPELVQQADDILGYSIAELCLQNPSDKLHRTLFAGPAIYTVNALTFSGKVRIDAPPDAATGYGVGEYSALFAAKVFDFATGLQLVQQRAELLSEERDGAMLMVTGLALDKVQETLEAQGFNAVEIAEYMSLKHCVLSGPEQHVEIAADWMKEVGAKRTRRLPGAGAFHCAMSLDVAAEFGGILEGIAFNDPLFPVIANCTAQPYTGSLVPECLMRQICSPILWLDTIQYLLQQPDPNFSEVGPGRALSFQVHLIQAANEAARVAEAEAKKNNVKETPAQC